MTFVTEKDVAEDDVLFTNHLVGNEDIPAWSCTAAVS